MGVSKRRKSVHTAEIKFLKGKINRITRLQHKYPMSFTNDRRKKAALILSTIAERIDYLRRNRTGSSSYEFTYVFKKNKR